MSRNYYIFAHADEWHRKWHRTVDKGRLGGPPAQCACGVSNQTGEHLGEHVSMWEMVRAARASCFTDDFVMREMYNELVLALRPYLPPNTPENEIPRAVASLRGQQQPEPIAMRLICPECKGLHIDRGEFATRPHHTHACQHCGNVWRPAIVNTVGVRFLPGFKNDTEIE